MLVYIAGPISFVGYEKAKKNFESAEANLLALGYEVVNPIRLVDGSYSWEDAMRVVISFLVWCDAICLLEGWERSRGARLEYLIAKELGLKIFRYNDVVGLPN